MKQHITPSHARKMTIGKMIEILGTVTITRSSDGNLWVVDGRYTHKELVDALWESVLDMFQFLK